MDENQKKALDAHLKIKAAIKDIVESMKAIRDALSLEGVEYVIVANLTGSTVRGELQYGGMRLNDGKPEAVELDFDHDPKVIAAQAEKIRQDIVEEMLRKLTGK